MDGGGLECAFFAPRVAVSLLRAAGGRFASVGWVGGAARGGGRARDRARRVSLCAAQCRGGPGGRCASAGAVAAADVRTGVVGGGIRRRRDRRIRRELSARGCAGASRALGAREGAVRGDRGVGAGTATAGGKGGGSACGIKGEAGFQARRGEAGAEDPAGEGFTSPPILRYLLPKNSRGSPSRTTTSSTSAMKIVWSPASCAECRRHSR